MLILISSRSMKRTAEYDLSLYNDSVLSYFLNSIAIDMPVVHLQKGPMGPKQSTSGL